MWLSSDTVARSTGPQTGDLVERLRRHPLGSAVRWTAVGDAPVPLAVTDPLGGNEVWALYEALRDAADELDGEPVCLSPAFCRDRLAEGVGTLLLRGRRARTEISLGEALQLCEIELTAEAEAILPELASLKDLPAEDGRSLPYGWPRALAGCRVAVLGCRPDEVPLHLGVGGWSRCPEPEVHAALLREWHRRWEARALMVTPDSLSLWVGEPPRHGDDLARIAAEQLLYAPNLALDTFVSPLCTEGGTPLEHAEHHVDVLGYAAMLRSHVWQLWWD